MDKAIILAKITTILHERFGIERDRIKEGTRMADLGIDSMHVLEVMLDLESELGIRLDDLALPPNPTLNDVADVIAENVA